VDAESRTGNVGTRPGAVNEEVVGAVDQSSSRLPEIPHDLFTLLDLSARHAMSSSAVGDMRSAYATSLRGRNWSIRSGFAQLAGTGPDSCSRVDAAGSVCGWGRCRRRSNRIRCRGSLSVHVNLLSGVASLCASSTAGRSRRMADTLIPEVANRSRIQSDRPGVFLVATGRRGRTGGSRYRTRAFSFAAVFPRGRRTATAASAG